MKVALSWIWPSRLAECSFRFERYLEGFRALGHEPVLVCARSSWSESFEAWDRHLAADRGGLREPGFWREVGADLVVVVAWHQFLPELAAMRAAGGRIAAFADTDGLVGRRVFARETARREWASHESLEHRLRWFRNRLGGRYWQWRRGEYPEDAMAVESTRLSDAVLFGHVGGAAAFSRVLEAAGAPELASRLHVVPFAIAEPFSAAPLAREREPRVVAIGRWDAVQKNVELLAEVVRRRFRERPDTRFDLFGEGREDFLLRLADRVPTLTVHGPKPYPEVARTLARARVLLMTSRWEGCPHAALEALTCGCTLVGTPMPSLTTWCAEGFGRVAPANAGELHRALRAELEAWEAGERDAPAIARTWRERLDPTEIARGILAAVGLPAGDLSVVGSRTPATS